MSKRRSTDKNQKEIVQALRKAGWRVWIIHEPVDLLVKRGKVIGVIEVKNPDGLNRPQKSQTEFMEGGGNCGFVRTVADALYLTDTFT